MGEVVDGEYQKYTVMPGAYIREHFFGVDPRLQALVADLTDEQLRKLQRGGHDPVKVYAAYQAAVEHRGAPTVILAKTIKGYGLGEAGEGRNITHQQKKLNEAGTAGVPRPLRHSHLRRAGGPRRSTSRRTTARRCVYLREHRGGAGRVRARPPVADDAS